MIVAGTPDGAPFERIHVMGADRDEIYFEVRRRPGRTTTEGYGIAVRYLPEQYPGGTVGDLTPCRVAGHLAHECTFRWDDQERRIVFVEVAGAMYRIIFRPGSAANWVILASVTIEP